MITSSKKIWNMDCPLCGVSRKFVSRQGYNYALNKNSVCNTCSGKQKYFSEEHRRKISESKTGNKNPMFGRIGFCGLGKDNPMWGKFGINHPVYGRKHSDESKEKMKISVAKYKMTPEHRNKMSLLMMGKNKGKIRSEETKLKMRISRLKRLEELGISQKEDKGANIFFKRLNDMGYSFYPKRFINIGYDADGYDENKHIWYEYDTPYHNVLCQQQKDLIRQQNIIRYFETCGNPLKAFFRVKADKYGNIIETKCVYQSTMNT